MNVAQHGNILAMLLLQVLNQNKYIKHWVVKSKSYFFKNSRKFSLVCQLESLLNFCAREDVV